MGQKFGRGSAGRLQSGPELEVLASAAPVPPEVLTEAAGAASKAAASPGCWREASAPLCPGICERPHHGIPRRAGREALCPPDLASKADLLLGSAGALCEKERGPGYGRALGKGRVGDGRKGPTVLQPHLPICLPPWKCPPTGGISPAALQRLLWLQSVAVQQASRCRHLLHCLHDET